MRWNTPVGRVALFLLAIVLAFAANAAWRSYQLRQLRAQQEHELKLQEQGAVDFFKHVGTPDKAMQETGYPFAPKPSAPPRQKSASEKHQ